MTTNIKSARYGPVQIWPQGESATGGNTVSLSGWNGKANELEHLVLKRKPRWEGKDLHIRQFASFTDLNLAWKASWGSRGLKVSRPIKIKVSNKTAATASKLSRSIKVPSGWKLEYGDDVLGLTYAKGERRGDLEKEDEYLRIWVDIGDLEMRGTADVEIKYEAGADYEGSYGVKKYQMRIKDVKDMTKVFRKADSLYKGWNREYYGSNKTAADPWDQAHNHLLDKRQYSEIRKLADRVFKSWRELVKEEEAYARGGAGMANSVDLLGLLLDDIERLEGKLGSYAQEARRIEKSAR